jgi:hypothetical protein
VHAVRACVWDCVFDRVLISVCVECTDELDEHHLNRVSVGCATEGCVTECEPPKQLLHHACDGTEPAFACTMAGFWRAVPRLALARGRTLESLRFFVEKKV